MAEATKTNPETNDPDVPKTRKAFVPLENNPEVMTSLVHKLGLSPALSFHDVYSITDPDMLAFVPRPAAALLLVFPISASYETSRMDEDKDKPDYEGKGAGEPVVWYKQTIRNACGLIGILHALSNGLATEFIEPDSDLHKLVKDAIPLAPAQRADLLYNSQALESAHQSAATQGDSAAPGAEDNIDLHYVCFVKDAKSNLWELDGRRKGPLNRGQLGLDEDVLSEKALELGVKKFFGEGGGCWWWGVEIQCHCSGSKPGLIFGAYNEDMMGRLGDCIGWTWISRSALE
ncbi:Ubiquitin carboxyl-terminal hydrolase isozyme L3 [Lachnellula occidentalis]|uniref:Ubiquitin carboxyl-terminal hydrolase n=1 Tax=Lachnellula occidentalis TaxID=215460 RepID=A0A8H8S6N3_9HELO|nr:Ubiquitin carboxyl-terminal hydrolase isozyme L3 [Lachnellula occidentalis]